MAMRIFLQTLMTLAVIAAATVGNAFGGAPRNESGRSAIGTRVTVYLFWTATCPHCASARRFLERVLPGISGAQLKALELDGEGTKEAAFIVLSKRFGNEPPAVPLIVIGEEAFVGYSDDATSGIEIERRIRSCLETVCEDVSSPILAQAGVTTPEAPSGPDKSSPRINRPRLPEHMTLPVVGTFETGKLSLPMLTIVLGAVDGFNPCAMWVLVLLIGLLVGMQDRLKMWSYGAVFLLTSAAVYFLFMAAWLNLFLFLGSLPWIRSAIGVFAVGAGAYYLREFVRNPDAACPLTSADEKERIRDRLRSIATERSFVLAILGIITLAVAVNMVELLCSAGIPAVYTQVLALSDLSATAHYAYLLLYITVFMLDDAAIFVAAMLTLQATGLAATYSRWSHLIGGGVLLGVGAVLILRPEWLAMI